MRSHSYLNSAREILDSYDGKIPLHIWLKDFFKVNKKFGSTDRKQILQLCYAFYRLGNSFQHLDDDERLMIAVFLCSDTTPFVIRELHPDWEEMISWSVDKKVARLASKVEVEKIFSWNNELSGEIDAQLFGKSFLVQPSLYLRIRPGKLNTVLQKLQEASINFTLLQDDCLEFPVGTKVEDFIEINKEAVVQDFNSQQVIKLVKPYIDIKHSFSIWDCCAASGGKSILFYDHLLLTQITVSDVRESILVNLGKRFQKAGIIQYKSFVTDLSTPTLSMNQKFDIVICDAPCTGSGTWSRTPEQLYFFTKEKINYYAALQKKIVRNAVKAVQIEGYFLYITCSVFKMENEDMVDYIQSELGLKLIKSNYYKGYELKADTLFAALFIAG